MTDQGTDYHEICRTCGTRADMLDAQERDGRMWIELTCGHWQQTPRPGEIVLSKDGGLLEIWGCFEYDPADL